MKSIKYYLNKLKNMSLKEFIYTVYSVYVFPRILTVSKFFYSFFSSIRLSINLRLVPLFQDINLKTNEKALKNLEYVCQKYCNHYFDLLGSGWIKNSFAENSFGFMGYKYPELVLQQDKDNEWLKKIVSKSDLKKAVKIYSHISDDYIPIDWQKDFKSGFRWSAKTWYLDVEYGNETGVDVKVPWELSRLQHLVRMAILYACEPEKNRYLMVEYKNQIMDFIAQNPPKKGINWRCTMDVGIRTANLALSYSIMKASGAVFEPFFEQLLASSILCHCKFIRGNLEWSASCRSNHYLSDVCGLLFGAAVLSDCTQRKKWLSFAREEIENELFLQFHEDGSNFEASVAYHRLSAELITYSLSLINKLAKEGFVRPLEQKCFDRLYKIGCFSYDTLLPDNTLYQCGDNDSGHFFNVTPIGDYCKVSDIKKKYLNLKEYNCLHDEAIYFDENMNRVDGLLHAINQLVNAGFGVSDNDSFEASIIQALDVEVHSYSYSKEPVRTSYKTEVSLPYKSEQKISLKDCDILDLKCILYPDFGLTIYKAKDLYLAICWSDNGQNGNAGHTHNDKLSFELWIKGKPYIRDPGTFVYTALPDERNKFRSVSSHSVLITQEEQNKYITLFSMENKAKCSLLECTDNTCSMLLNFGNTMQRRQFTILNNCIIIGSESNVPFEENFVQKCLTNGYGKLISLEDKK